METIIINVCLSAVTTAFVAGGFYQLVLWRLKKLEQKSELQDDLRDRMVRMETKIDLLIVNERA